MVHRVIESIEYREPKEMNRKDMKEDSKKPPTDLATVFLITLEVQLVLHLHIFIHPS